MCPPASPWGPQGLEGPGAKVSPQHVQCASQGPKLSPPLPVHCSTASVQAPHTAAAGLFRALHGTAPICPPHLGVFPVPCWWGPAASTRCGPGYHLHSPPGLASPSQLSHSPPLGVPHKALIQTPLLRPSLVSLSCQLVGSYFCLLLSGLHCGARGLCHSLLGRKGPQ